MAVPERGLTGQATAANGGASIAQNYRFDLASSSPIDASGVARVWVPAVKLTQDASGYVTKVQAKFFTNDGTN